MRALSAADMLHLWETVRGYHPVDQGLAMLAAADPARSRDELAALPLGQRDARLLALRQASLGDCAPARTPCPRCQETLEFDLACSALQDAPAPGSSAALSVEDYQIQWRPLDSVDLAAVAGMENVDDARRALAARCVVDARCGGDPIPPATLPPRVVAALADALLEADPRAEILLELTCPRCNHSWQAAFDIVRFFWSEITARAQRLLVEVHLLARAYGWSEADILALSPGRRAAYLQLVGA